MTDGRTLSYDSVALKSQDKNGLLGGKTVVSEIIANIF